MSTRTSLLGILVVFVFTLFTVSCSGQPDPGSSGAVDDYASLVEHLRAAGNSVEPGGNLSQPFFTPVGQLIAVDGHDVQVFEFPDSEAAKAAASTISEDGGSVGATIISWVAPPHFFQAGRLIVLYVGEEAEVIQALEGALGPQTAGE